MRGWMGKGIHLLALLRRQIEKEKGILRKENEYWPWKAKREKSF